MPARYEVQGSPKDTSDIYGGNGQKVLPRSMYEDRHKSKDKKLDRGTLAQVLSGLISGRNKRKRATNLFLRPD